MNKDLFYAELTMNNDGSLNHIDCCMVGNDQKMTFTSFEKFLDHIADYGKKSKNLSVYFHDLEYQGRILSAYLTSNSKADIKDKKDKLTDGDIKVVASRGSWYKVSLIYKKKRIHFFDSRKIIPFDIDKIKRELHIDETDSVLIMAKAIESVSKYGLTEKMTIGSCCMQEFRELTPEFDGLFPKLDDDIDAFIRSAYMGGWMYIKNSIIGKAIEHCGFVYDANSLYPSQMKEKEFPIKNPKYFDGEEFDSISHMPYFVHFTACLDLKKNHFPFIYAPNNAFSDDQGYLTTTNMETIELILTKPDFELMFEQYDVDELEIIDGYWFMKRKGVFDRYIDKWYTVKKNAKNPVERLIAKLFLNNLYGKFGTEPKTYSNVPYLYNGEFRMRTEETQVSTVYVPVAAYVTAYGRQETIKAAQEHYDAFLYSDTDSVHSLEELTDIKIGKELGEWKLENKFSAAKYIKAKTYIEKMIEKDCMPCKPYWVMKAAGASDESKQKFLYGKTDADIMKQFKIGLELTENYKKQVVGNTVIKEAFTFKIR